MSPFIRVVVDVLATGAVGVGVWWLYEKLQGHWPAIAKWSTLEQRALVAALCPLVVTPVFAFAVWMRWLPQPGDWRAWLTVIGDYALAAFLWSQGPHAIQKDRQEAKKRAEQ